ncbi:uncharacterized protein AMSG_11935 [Thecamonas trahens ATCC 50062]|uniref:Uncharacterized protein n=1 Tax=Thecamonas trahens ATCC 50062 TaxID=461836 RepID=A0A0L0DEQ7_THETB|nr:hypothetical protein AMSG_11935 [Thecamonas trahens ATCC 50062]KNC49808.1 hypothetical protein AMSG_11935 [Thecamonas trahens ATCC 50062]|eukprot:XP_013757615.1 hypothetical protein AMSG_11935 [Thecamonas trahens ATCC 50062]
MSATSADVVEVESSAHIQLAFCEPLAHPDLVTRGFFPHKVGGAPAWLDPAATPAADALCCGNCGKKMAFMLQIYAPRRNVAAAFHRALYVFACKAGGCNDAPGAQAVVRSQLPLANPYYVADMADARDGPEGELNAAVLTPDELEGKVCLICRAVPAKRCGKCSAVAYCGRHHQADDWARGHAAECGTLAGASSSAADGGHIVVAERSGVSPFVFPEHELVMEAEEDVAADAAVDEPSDDLVAATTSAIRPRDVEKRQHLERLIAEYEKEEARARKRGEPAPLDNDAGDDGAEPAPNSVEAAIADLVGHQDFVYNAFKDRTSIAPDQVLRYFVDDADEPSPALAADREPLPVSGDDPLPVPEDVPPCGACGAPRVFEFQILPQLLFYLLHPDLEAGDGFIDFANIVVYTCSAHCSPYASIDASHATLTAADSHNGAYLVEHVVRQRSMAHSAIRTYCRIRPSPGRASSLYSVDALDKRLRVAVPRVADPSAPQNLRETYEFGFTDILDADTKQDEVFEKVAAKSVKHVLEGYNATLFAYGQTGSGKTYTMTGGPESYAARGIIPRALSLLFDSFADDPTTHYSAHISYLEIYNNTGYDLLNPTRESTSLEDLPQVVVQEAENGAILLRNLSAHQANSEEEALNLLFLGDTTRMIAETPLNDASSRSHCIFTVAVTASKDGEDTVRASKLHLVDLAGSERVGRTGVQGQLLTEAKYINVSLHHLELVIMALRERATKGRNHIPYRNSMMTTVLRDSLGGNCMTVMIATLNFDEPCLLESISTCRFASRVAQITNTVRINEELNPDVIIKRLKAEVRHLKEELALATGRDADRGPITDSERARVAAAVRAYIADTSPDAALPFVEMILIREAYAVFKSLALQPGAGALPSASPAPSSAPHDAHLAAKYRKLKGVLKQRDAEIEILMGMVEKAKAEPVLASAARSSAEATTQTPALGYYNSRSAVTSGPSPPSAAAHPATTKADAENSAPVQAVRVDLPSSEPEPEPSSEPALPSRDEAFEAFKASYANTEWLASNQELLKDKYAEAKALGEEVNASRQSINGVKAMIEQLRVERAMQGILDDDVHPDAPNTSAPDSEEARLKVAVEKEKAKYKRAFYKLKDLRREIEHLQLLMEKNRVKMSQDFEVYYLTLATRAQAASHPASPSQASRASPTPPPTSPLPLTGNKEADDEILRYQAAREKLLRAQGKLPRA